jgi:CheY-like chemotaxis protein
VRLADVGIAGYKTAAALKGVVAQRLMRRLCVRCRQAQTGSLPAAIRDRIASASTYRAAGCDECSQTGYRGRLSIAEILVVDAEVERRITSGDSTERIYEAARRNGMQSLWESAVAHVRDGVTSVEELLRVIEVPAHAESPSLADVVAAASSPPAPPLANRVFEGAAFDLVDEYAVAARRQRVALIIGGGPSHQHVRSLFAAHDFTVHESELAKAPELVDSRTPDVVLVGAAADSAPILARLRAHPAMRRVPVVVIASRSADEEAEVRAFEAGANEYFSLPLRPRVFIARVSALIESRTR